MMLTKVKDFVKKHLSILYLRCKLRKQLKQMVERVQPFNSLFEMPRGSALTVATRGRVSFNSLF